ncbi:HupE/UreJ family protein [Marinobacter mobilis]|uniref:HupE / UreJ protein n=1 Tax=Marinobacter mobilis TaxID=488533 RepID=A0A1H2XY04_9GAMM|nr:HupE/UreJ family protein [Marinobacter mobilis]SDW97209.1 HupE / UreJ protein [Marinobacter mobilis]
MKATVVPALLLSLFSLICAGSSHADELRPAYLQLTETSADSVSIYWKVPARGARQRLALEVILDGTSEALSVPIERFVNGVNVRHWQIHRPGGLMGLGVTVDGLARSGAEVLARVEYLDGTSATHRLTAEAPAFRIADKPGLLETVSTYFVLGVEHILFGIDHLLFVTLLLLLVHTARHLAITVTAFTVAHSITLILASLEIIQVPVLPVEVCIALSIVFLATEIIRGEQGKPGLTASAPWLVALGFGLLHGLGFAAALNEIGLPRHAVMPALVVFNLGVEAGQLVFIAVVLTVGRFLPAGLKQTPVWQVRVPAYAVGSLAAFWAVERAAGF